MTIEPLALLIAGSIILTLAGVRYLGKAQRVRRAERKLDREIEESMEAGWHMFQAECKQKKYGEEDYLV